MSIYRTRSLKRHVFIALATLLGGFTATAQVSLSTSTAYTQDFNAIGASGTATLPASFRADRVGTARTLGTWSAAGTATTQTGGTSVSTTASNGIWNFGATANSSDRSIGFISSSGGTNTGNLYVQLANNTASAMTGLQVSYNVEKYRNGSNAAGFRYQMFYSTDGSASGTNFLTTFAANADNTGFASAPGSSTAVSNQTLTVSIPASSTIYLAWSFSVATGTTSTNSQGLAIDDISILGLGSGGGGTTNPSGSGSASPATVTAGNATTFTANAVGGTNSVSTVTCDLSAIGGSSTFSLPNTSGNSYSAIYTVPGATASSAYSLPCTVTDTASLTGTFNISLTVTAASGGSCGASKTRIGTVQGTGASSTLTGSSVTIEGIVTGAYQGTSGLTGFYLQDEGDGNPNTSDGIFINEAIGGSQGAVSVGQQIRLTGTVAELFNQTSMNTVTSQTSCSVTITIAPTDVTLPAATATDLEKYEGMLVRFPQQLRVTDNYDLGRFGELSLALVPDYNPGVTFTRLMSGTQVATPGAAALAVEDLNARSKFVLDDGSDNTYGNQPVANTWPTQNGGLSATNTVRLGSRVNVDAQGVYTPLQGVLGFDFSVYRLQPVPGQPDHVPRSRQPAADKRALSGWTGEGHERQRSELLHHLHQPELQCPRSRQRDGIPPPARQNHRRLQNGRPGRDCQSANWKTTRRRLSKIWSTIR